jgi:hypothetical protein
MITAQVNFVRSETEKTIDFLFLDEGKIRNAGSLDLKKLSIDSEIKQACAELHLTMNTALRELQK